MTKRRNEYGLTERDMHTVQNILQKYPDVKEVNIFGSRAKRNYNTGSDIDLVVMNEGVNTKTMTKMLNDFEESSLPYRVDLVYFPTLTHPEFLEHLNRVGKLFFSERHMSL